MPDVLRSIEHQITEVNKELARLMVIMKKIGDECLDSILDEVRETEARKSQLETTRATLMREDPGELEIPSDDWIRLQLSNLVNAARQDYRNGARLLRDLLGSICVENVRAPGERRGFRRLRFKFFGLGALRAGLAHMLPSALLERFAASVSGDDFDNPGFTIDLGQPCRMALMAPRIGQLRAEGRTWAEVAAIVGLPKSAAQLAWKRYCESCRDHEHASRDTIGHAKVLAHEHKQRNSST